jgi:hypothetical protein
MTGLLVPFYVLANGQKLPIINCISEHPSHNIETVLNDQMRKKVERYLERKVGEREGERERKR